MFAARQGGRGRRFGGGGMQRGAAQQTEAVGPEARSLAQPTTTPGAPGLDWERSFSREGIDPFDEIEWELRSATIANEKGELVFEQRDVEIPKFWSQQATNIVVSKYFRGPLKPTRPGERESSVRQLIG